MLLIRTLVFSLFCDSGITCARHGIHRVSWIQVKLSMSKTGVWLGTVLSCMAMSAESAETDKPKWEAGIGLGAQDLNHYRGSDQRTTTILPLPFALYSGKYLKINRDGARGEVFKAKKVELNISADAALSGSSEPNRAREGMPDLDSSFELGPSLNFLLAGESFSDGFALRLPARVVVTAGSDGVRQRGYVFNPRFTWRKPNAFAAWNSSVSLGALWGNHKYHAYYYSVDDEYVTDTREAYKAGAGFAGYYSKFSVSRRWDTWLLALSVRYDNLSGATFEDSPLIRTKNYSTFSFGVAKTFWTF